jgi:hypothetical protein
MPTKRKTKLIFEYSNEELSAELENTLNIELRRKAKMNLPVVYRNSLCQLPNQFIHEYPNGKRLLIQQNSKNSEEIVLKEL